MSRRISREMFSQWGSSISLFAVSFVIGGFVALNPFDFDFSSGQLRNPASLQGKYDLTHLRGDELIQGSKVRVLEGLKVKQKAGSFEIQLGHFLFKNRNEEVVKACDEFSQVELIWQADGMAVSGEAPQMRVTGPCQISANLSSLGPLYLPLQKMMESVAQDSVVQLSEYPNQAIEFRGLSGEWPGLWVLRSISLSGENSRLDLAAEEIVQTLQQPVVLHVY